MWLPNSKDDQPEHSEEVKDIAGHTIEGDECAKLANDDVDCRHGGVPHHGVDWCKPDRSVLVAHDVADLREETSLSFRLAGCTNSSAIASFTGRADLADETWEKAFLAGGICETATGESRGIQGAKARERHYEGED